MTDLSSAANRQNDNIYNDQLPISRAAHQLKSARDGLASLLETIEFREVEDLDAPLYALLARLDAIAVMLDLPALQEAGQGSLPL